MRTAAWPPSESFPCRLLRTACIEKKTIATLPCNAAHCFALGRVKAAALEHLRLEQGLPSNAIADVKCDAPLPPSLSTSPSPVVTFISRGRGTRGILNEEEILRVRAPSSAQSRQPQPQPQPQGPQSHSPDRNRPSVSFRVFLLRHEWLALGTRPPSSPPP
jgi:hypothetical protein